MGCTQFLQSDDSVTRGLDLRAGTNRMANVKGRKRQTWSRHEHDGSRHSIGTHRPHIAAEPKVHRPYMAAMLDRQRPRRNSSRFSQAPGTLWHGYSARCDGAPESARRPFCRLCTRCSPPLTQSCNPLPLQAAAARNVVPAANPNVRQPGARHSHHFERPFQRGCWECEAVGTRSATRIGITLSFIFQQPVSSCYTEAIRSRGPAERNAIPHAQWENQSLSRFLAVRKSDSICV
jgi:hypothetical protein